MPPNVIVLRFTERPENLIEIAYMQCQSRAIDIPENWMKKDWTERLDKIMKDGHFSVLEHPSITFQITGISRSCSHQIVRHRIGIAISQMSMRHTPIGDTASLVIPATIAEIDDADGAYKNMASLSHGTYQALIKEGVPMEDARMILPIGTVTELVMTFNARALLHFLRLRLSKHAQWEVRKVADIMWCFAMEWAPNVFDPKYRECWE